MGPSSSTLEGAPAFFAGLVREGRPVIGVVHVPVTGACQCPARCSACTCARTSGRGTRAERFTGFAMNAPRQPNAARNEREGIHSPAHRMTAGGALERCAESMARSPSDVHRRGGDNRADPMPTARRRREARCNRRCDRRAVTPTPRVPPNRRSSMRDPTRSRPRLRSRAAPPFRVGLFRLKMGRTPMQEGPPPLMPMHSRPDRESW
jgi:hypothetical protein